jgi:hypothetical protein
MSPQAAEQMDPRELAEREGAAKAYVKEDETHYVRFLDDCVKTSVDTMRDIRLQQDECWRVYNEEEPRNFNFKELWQSRITYPKPYKLVQFGMSIVRKAFDVEFLSIENEGDVEAAKFWEKLMRIQLSRNYANFPIQFVDAVGMSLAVGQSMEMIPVYHPGKGLRYILVEPWKIHRDPDAVSRQPQSGMYWIHQEFMPYHVLKEWEDQGRFKNIVDIGPGSNWYSRTPDLTAEELARRKGMVYSKSAFQKSLQVLEFWGTILSPRGETILPNATFTGAGGRVISEPKVSPYPTLRWPGIGFSALPHMLRFDGRGLIHGIRSLWYLMCNMMSLHADHLNWAVNPMLEVDISSLVDQGDTDVYPGKVFPTYGSQQGQQVVRAVDLRSQANELIAMLNFYDQRHQDGGLLDYSAMGAPGYRAEVTAREAAQNLDQSMTVVGSMGKNLEDGALNAIVAGAETVAINMTYDELAMLMGPEVAEEYRRPVSDEFPTGLELPQLTTGRFHVSGITALMKEHEKLQQMATLITPLFDPNGLGQVFLPFLKPGGYLNEIVRLTRLTDSKFSVEPDKAIEIDQRQQDQQDAKITAQQAQDAATAAQVQADAERKAAEAAKLQAEAEEKMAKANTLAAQAELHRAKAELAQAQADALALKAPAEADLAAANAEAAGAEGSPQGPSEVDIAEAERVRALIPHEIDLARQKVDSEAAKGELTRAQADAVAHPDLLSQKVDTEKAQGELVRAKAKVAAIPPKPAAKPTTKKPGKK